jgi:hypothetical protein
MEGWREEQEVSRYVKKRESGSMPGRQKRNNFLIANNFINAQFVGETLWQAALRFNFI